MALQAPSPVLGEAPTPQEPWKSSPQGSSGGSAGESLKARLPGAPEGCASSGTLAGRRPLVHLIPRSVQGGGVGKMKATAALPRAAFAQRGDPITLPGTQEDFLFINLINKLIT